MRERLIGGIVPLTEAIIDSATRAHPADHDARDDDIVVLDEGHLDSTVYVASQQAGVNRHTTAPSLFAATERGAAAMAVLVRPMREDLRPASCDAHRTLPTGGREWCRQRAILQAVGPAAQEAIIDLHVDPRYRRPGEYLQWALGRRDAVPVVKS